MCLHARRLYSISIQQQFSSQSVDVLQITWTRARPCASNTRRGYIWYTQFVQSNCMVVLHACDGATLAHVVYQRSLMRRHSHTVGCAIFCILSPLLLVHTKRASHHEFNFTTRFHTMIDECAQSWRPSAMFDIESAQPDLVVGWSGGNTATPPRQHFFLPFQFNICFILIYYFQCNCTAGKLLFAL